MSSESCLRSIDTNVDQITNITEKYKKTMQHNSDRVKIVKEIKNLMSSKATQ